MSEYHDHRDDCPFKFATLDVCDCVEKNMLDRIEALTAKLATCEKYRDAYAECDRIGTQTVRDLEAKLAKAVEALDYCIKAPFSGWTIAQGYARATIAEIKGESHD